MTIRCGTSVFVVAVGLCRGSEPTSGDEERASSAMAVLGVDFTVGLTPAKKSPFATNCRPRPFQTINSFFFFVLFTCVAWHFQHSKAMSQCNVGPEARSRSVYPRKQRKHQRFSIFFCRGRTTFQHPHTLAVKHRRLNTSPNTFRPCACRKRAFPRTSHNTPNLTRKKPHRITSSVGTL